MSVAESREDIFGRFEQRFECAPPPAQAVFRVLDEEWNQDHSVRTIRRLELVGVEPGATTVLAGEIVGVRDGLTDAERVVSDYLTEAVNAFAELDRRHPSELADFVDGIHACQNQLAWRIVQRTHPEAWPVKGVSAHETAHGGDDAAS